mmetsp:Transcript_69574/g.180915  ORF Transcript_69574/g.180915 Transcript_69574/m.180915 type:complete len:217 (+) Transcript_69574:870-1520(+)
MWSRIFLPRKAAKKQVAVQAPCENNDCFLVGFQRYEGFKRVLSMMSMMVETPLVKLELVEKRLMPRGVDGIVEPVRICSDTIATTKSLASMPRMSWFFMTSSTSKASASSKEIELKSRPRFRSSSCKLSMFIQSKCATVGPATDQAVAACAMSAPAFCTTSPGAWAPCSVVSNFCDMKRGRESAGRTSCRLKRPSFAHGLCPTDSASTPRMGREQM